MSKPTFQVALQRSDKCILTPGELSLEEARQKASYLSQYGAVSILGILRLRDMRERGSPGMPSPLLSHPIPANGLSDEDKFHRSSLNEPMTPRMPQHLGVE